MDFYKIDGYFEVKFQTQRFDTGAATDADALPTYRVYEENNETAVATGDCVKRDDGNTVGYYYARAQCTAAAGFEVGKTYSVRVAATVNSVSGAAEIGKFKILAASVYDALTGGAGGMIPADTIGLSGDTTAADNAEKFFDGTGYAGTNNVIPVVTAVTNGVTLTANQDVRNVTGTLPTVVLTAGHGLALEDTLSAIKGAGWTNETLKALKTVVDAILADTGTDGVKVADKAGYALTTPPPDAATVATAVAGKFTFTDGKVDANATVTGVAEQTTLLAVQAAIASVAPTGSTTLTDTVVDGNGTPIVGATVYLTADDGSGTDLGVTLQTTSSDASGTYSFSVDPGWFWVHAYKLGEYELNSARKQAT